jgi:hypothetical protein
MQKSPPVGKFHFEPPIKFMQRRVPARVHENTEKLTRLAPFLFLGVTLQLFLELLVLYHLIGALPNFFFQIGIGPLEVP